MWKEVSGLGSVTISSSRAVWVLFVGDDQPADDALGPVRADDDRGAVLALIGFQNSTSDPLTETALDGRILLDEETALARLAGQPGIELVPADGAEGKCARFFCAHAHAFAVVIEMRPVHIEMRHFTAVQSQGMQDHFGIR